jgi:hypothetical protein
LEKLDKLVFHKNLKDFFWFFLGTTFENTLLVDDMLHKSMFSPLYSVIFFKTFYRSHTNINNLLHIVLLYLELLHFSGMRIYKFLELNPFGSITDVALGDPRYEKLNACCSAKCNETFYNKIKLRFVNKKG